MNSQNLRVLILKIRIWALIKRLLKLRKEGLKNTNNFLYTYGLKSPEMNIIKSEILKLKNRLKELM